MKDMEMSKGATETHHIMVEFKDAKDGKALTSCEEKVKVKGPGKAEQSKVLMGIQGHFLANFDLPRDGKYDVMSRLQLKDGKCVSPNSGTR